MSQCKVLLDNYSGQYIPGAVIQGRVVINLDSDITLRGIRITLTCVEHTEWLGTESYYDSDAKEQKSRTTQFTGDNEVFSFTNWLYGDQHGSTNLPMGQHIYPFSLNLQKNIPSSYQGKNGSILYKLTATVDKPMALDNEDSMIVVINSPIDLNMIATTSDLQPSSYSDEKNLCCWCCVQGPLSMDVELSKRTLTPGEKVEVKMHLTNMTNTNVEGVSLELKQILTYKVTDPSSDDKVESNILVDLKDVGLGAHGENTYIFQVNLPPNLVIPNFAQCRLFQIEYNYKAIAKLSSMHNNLEVFMTPIIGHIPLGKPTSGSDTMGWVSPSAPSLYPKEQQLHGIEGNGPNQFEPPPPSYDSLN